MKLNLPNQITVGRLFLAIVFFACLSQFDAAAEPMRLWLLNLSAGLFLVAALTDVLDGYLARKHNQVTSFGRIIDPFVDKILVIGAYTFMAGERFVDADGAKITHVADWMVVVILGRELFVTSLRGVTESSGQSFGANFYGKLKMGLQSTTVVWVLLVLANPGPLGWLLPVSPWLVYATVAVTLLSAIPYVLMGRNVLSQTAVAAK